jgi:hypothetical protein
MVRVGREHVERDVCIAVVVVGGGGGGGDGGMGWNMRSSSQRRLEYGPVSKYSKLAPVPKRSFHVTVVTSMC